MRKSVVGHTCMVCGTIGVHFEDACPHKEVVGMPESFRTVIHERTVAAVRATHFFPPEHIEACELLPILRTSKLAPAALCCVSCDMLALEAIWCAKCDAVACATCMGPLTQTYDDAMTARSFWACPRCRCIEIDMFHEVGALRVLAKQWLETSAIAADAIATATLKEKVK